MRYFFEAVIDFPADDAEARASWWRGLKASAGCYAAIITTMFDKHAAVPVSILVEDRKVVLHTVPHVGVDRAAFDLAVGSIRKYLERFKKSSPAGFTYATSEPVGAGNDAGILSGGGWVFISRDRTWEETSMEAFVRFQEINAKNGSQEE